MSEAGRSYRGFQFHLRGLLSLVTVAALLCAFWTRLYVAPRRAEMQARRAQTQAEDVVRKLGGHVRLLNDIRLAVTLHHATDDDLALIGELEYFQRNLKSVNLQGSAVTDDGIRNLQAVRRLEFANLVDTRVTDEGIEVFRTKHPAASIVYGSTDAEKWSHGKEAVTIPLAHRVYCEVHGDNLLPEIRELVPGHALPTDQYEEDRETKFPHSYRLLFGYGTVQVRYCPTCRQTEDRLYIGPQFDLIGR